LYTREHHTGRQCAECIAIRYLIDGSEFKTLSEVLVFSSLQLSKPALRLTHSPVNGRMWSFSGIKRQAYD